MRTARLNKKVLALDIRRLDGRIKAMEVMIGLSTSSSIGGFWFFETFFGALIWKTMGATAVVLLVLKPILRFAEEKDAQEALLTGYSLLEEQLRDVAREAQMCGAYTEQMMDMFRRVIEKKKVLIEAGVKSRVSRDEITVLQDEVEQELQEDHFYFPPT